MSNLILSYRSPGELKPRERAFRTHPEEQMRAMCASLKEYGCNDPVAIDGEDNIVCGTAVVAAAVRLGLNSIPVVVLDHLNKIQLRAYAIAANKLADLAGYDDVELAQELAEIKQLLGDVDLPEFGIDTPELDRLFALAAGPGIDDELTEPAPGPVISQAGDLWMMGDHGLNVANALEADSYPPLMAGEQAQAVLSDLPYNRETSSFSTTGRFDNFKQGAGEMTSPQFVRFMTIAMRNAAQVSESGSLHLFFMSYHFLLELLRAGSIVYGDLKSLITWDKQVPGLGSLWRHQSEFIAAFKHGKAPHRVHANKRNRTTVWQTPGLSVFQPDRAELLAGHPSTKPIALIKEAVLDISDRGGIVLDPFAGSGTLALACEEVGRRARMIELDEVYADVALRRFQKATGMEPVLQRTGQTFAEREAEIIHSIEQHAENNHV